MRRFNGQVISLTQAEFDALGGRFEEGATYVVDQKVKQVGASTVSAGGAVGGLASKILAARARRPNVPWRTTVYNKPAAWTANEVVRGGEMRLANNAWWVAKVGGTCGASAPTWAITPDVVAPFDAVTDNTVKWVYYAPDTDAYKSDTSVAISISNTRNAAVATTSTAYVPVTGTYGTVTGSIFDPVNTNPYTPQFVPNSGTVSIASWVSELFRAPNANFIYGTQTSGGVLGLSLGTCIQNAAGTLTQSGLYWEFETESPVLEIGASQFDVGAAAIGGTYVLVDDVLVQAGTLLTPTAYLSGGASPVGNNDLYLDIVFTGPRRRRNVKVFGLLAIRNVRTTANTALRAPRGTEVRGLLLGDSHFGGSGEGPIRAGFTWPQIAMAELGLSPMTNASTGGTGVEVAGSGLKWIDRLNQVSAVGDLSNVTIFSASRNKYDFVWVELPSGNDTATGTLQANTVALLRRIRELQPTALVIAHGGFPATNPTAADALNVIAKAAFAEWGDSNSVYISTRSDAPGGAWIDGTGRNASGQVAATGNSSLYIGSDGTHGNDACLLYLGQRSAFEIQKVVGL